MLSRFNLLFSLAVVCLVSVPAQADFYIATGAEQSIVNNQGETKFVRPTVGTNEQGTPPAWVVAVRLTAKGPGGFECTITGELPARQYKPAVPMPVRLEVFYPKGARLNLGPMRSTYTVTAIITSITPVPTGDVAGNNKHEFSFPMPSGGTPKCVNTLTGQTTTAP
jgi:hypothetical protein